MNKSYYSHLTDEAEIHRWSHGQKVTQQIRCGNHTLNPVLFIFTITCCSGATSRFFTFMVSPLSSKKYKVLTPVPKHMSLFRNSIFCRQSSSDQVKVWGKVLIQYGWHHKKGEFGHRYVHREDQVKTEWKLSMTKGSQRWLEARWEGGRRFSVTALRKKQPWFQTSNLQNHETIHFFC